MLVNKRRNQLVALAILSLVMWVIVMGGVAFFYLMMQNDRIPVIPGTKAVPLSSYQSLLDMTRVTLFGAIPAFASGYLLLGLLLLRHVVGGRTTDQRA